MHIEIHLPTSWTLLGLLVLSAAVRGAHHDSIAGAVGGSTDAASIKHTVALERTVQELWHEQQTLLQQEAMLRAQLQSIERELQQANDPVLHQSLRLTRTDILSLIADRTQAEERMRESLRQLRESEQVALRASAATYTPRSDRSLRLSWPVEARYGVSAYFHDESYRSRFGLAHNAIDIPVEQGSTIAAAASGIVEKVSDNGLGYSSLIISHQDGYATVYGHVSGFLVEEGQHVIMGEPVALSGGRPGSKGAGSLTTGPHLHFELLKNGAHVDPMDLLPDTKLQ